jgi:Fungal protein of unknown function (DUF2011)
LGSAEYESERDVDLPDPVFEYEENNLVLEPSNGAGGEDVQSEEEEFEFRLFSSKAGLAAHGKDKDNGRLARINIRSPTPLLAQGDGGLIVPSRPRSYYFTGVGVRGEQDRSSQCLEVAVAGDEVMARAKSLAWVCQS